jgi:hypothetical protein
VYKSFYLEKYENEYYKVLHTSDYVNVAKSVTNSLPASPFIGRHAPTLKL